LNAASSLLAMIRRGTIWSTTKGDRTITYGAAYGDRPSRCELSNEERERRRNERQSRQRERAGLTSESPCCWLRC
jgi:hypothetical protein